MVENFLRCCYPTLFVNAPDTVIWYFPPENNMFHVKYAGCKISYLLSLGYFAQISISMKIHKGNKQRPKTELTDGLLYIPKHTWAKK